MRTPADPRLGPTGGTEKKCLTNIFIPYKSFPFLPSCVATSPGATSVLECKFLIFDENPFGEQNE